MCDRSTYRTIEIVDCGIKNETKNTPKVVKKECANRIEGKFFSIDNINRRDGVQRVVEIGDGQVSDLVGRSTVRFVRIWITTAKILREM
jgi:hypothetical protein